MEKVQKNSANSVQQTPSSESFQVYQPHYCWEGVFTVALHSNGSYSIVALAFVAAGMCLPSRCLTMNIYSDFTIPAFGHHIKILNWCKKVSGMNGRAFSFYELNR
jgi:hypothetical protein